MFRATLLIATLALTVSGCARLAESRLNPFNWFGASTAAPITASASQNSEIRPLVPENRRIEIVESRPLMQSIVAMNVDRAPAGAIVRATAVAPAQGYFDAELVNAGVSNGVLTLEFRARAPAGFQADGSARTRQITAAYMIDAQDLADIRTVRVQAATNARTSRR